MNRPLICLFILCVLSGGINPAWANFSPEADRLIKQALQEPDLNKKISLYQRALELDPQNPDTHNNIGILYKQKGDYDKAESHYKSALASPNYRTPEYVYYNLGVLYKDRAKYKEAIPFFEQALSANPKFDKAYNGLGLCYKALGNLDEAVNKFNEALKINPENVQASNNLTNVWRLPASSQKEKTEQLYEEGVAFINVVSSEEMEDTKLAKLEKAQAKFEEALKLDPQSVKVKEKLELVANLVKFYKLRRETRAFIRQFRWDEASASLTQAAKFAARPEEKDIVEQIRQTIGKQLKEQPQERGEIANLFRQGQASIAQQDWLSAISQFTKILMLAPENKEARGLNDMAKGGYYYQKGMLALESQDEKEAEKNFRNALAVYSRQDDARKQLELLERKQKDNDVLALLAEGEKNFKAGSIIAARRNYSKVLAIDPKNTAAMTKMKELEALPNKTEKDIINTVKTPINLIILLIGGTGLYMFVFKVLRPKDIMAHYRKLKEFDNARLVYENILERDSNRRVVYAPLAGLYLKLKNSEGVDFLVNLCQQKLADPDRSDLPLWHVCLGEIYRESGQMHEAQEEMEYAYEQSPHNPEILHKLSALYENLLERNPDNEEVKLRLKQISNAKALLPIPQADTPVMGYSGIQESAPASAGNDEEQNLKLLKECFKRPNRNT